MRLANISTDKVVAIFVDPWVPEDRLLEHVTPPHLRDVASWDTHWVGHPKAWDARLACNIAEAYRVEGIGR